MNAFTNAIRVVGGLTIGVVALALFAAFGIAIVGVTLVAALGTAVAVKLSGPKPAPVAARAKAQPRVWNDGRGTIIDM
ncbi:hypothetical protein [Pararhizobium haloflavum]|uniref:hypothetical protein n=1 Tax=Pararhizobium haloflavum TaxID=2037914 RepID=UPI000C17B6C7|nr:hypothetical protein [Pararhizobium haloflavum]